MTIQLDLPVVKNKANFGGPLSPREGVHGTPYEQPGGLSVFSLDLLSQKARRVHYMTRTVILGVR